MVCDLKQNVGLYRY